MYTIREFSAFYSHFQVTFGQMTSLPGHFRSNDVTSGSLPVTLGRVIIYCHVTASYCELQPCRK